MSCMPMLADQKLDQQRGGIRTQPHIKMASARETKEKINFRTIDPFQASTTLATQAISRSTADSYHQAAKSFRSKLWSPCTPPSRCAAGLRSSNRSSPV